MLFLWKERSSKELARKKKDDELNTIIITILFQNQPSEGEDISDYKFRHITEITILTVQLIVEFSKRLPGFDELMREDQMALLKACSSEVMMLRMARKYDVQTDSIIFANNQPYTRDSYNVAGMGETIEDLLHFCRQMYAMKVNNAEYALLTAIVIFSGTYTINFWPPESWIWTNFSSLRSNIIKHHQFTKNSVNYLYNTQDH